MAQKFRVSGHTSGVVSHNEEPETFVCSSAENLTEGCPIPFGRPPYFTPLKPAYVTSIHRCPYLKPIEQNSSNRVCKFLPRHGATRARRRAP